MSGEHSQSERDGDRTISVVVTAGAAGARTRLDSTELPHGTRVGPFVISNTIASGGMGVVYEARDPRLDRSVALKMVLPRAVGEHGEGVSRLLREARSAARLSHPNVVAVHECGVFEGGVYIAMELVRGDTIRRWLAREQRSVDAIVDALLQAGQALVAAHAQGLVHRDVKPDNILINEDGVVKVVDFGLAREATSPSRSGEQVGETGEHQPADDKLTAAGALLGTPGYMPPEYFDHAEVGPALDQFAFSVTAYELLYREKPFQRSAGGSRREAMRAGNVRPAPTGSKVAGAYRRILLRGLAPEPGSRFSSMSELVGEMSRVRGRARRRAFGLLAFGVVVFSVVAGRYSLSDDPAGECRTHGSTREHELRVGLEKAVAHLDGLPPSAALPVRERFASGAGPWVQQWAQARASVCEPEGSRSPAERQLTEVCLDAQARETLALFETVAAIDVTAARHLVTAPLELPSLAACEDVVTLGSQPPIPTDAHAREAIDKATNAADQINALVAVGRFARATQLAEQLRDDVAAIEHPPTLTKAYAAIGGVHLALADHEAGIDMLRRALQQAEAAHAPRQRFILWLELAKALAKIGNYGGAVVALDAAEAVAQTVGDSNRLEARTKLARAEVAALADERELAARLYNEVLGLDLREEERERALYALGDVTYGLASAEEAADYHRQALDLRIQRLGPRHPLVGESLSALGRILKSADLEEAEAVLQQALEIQQEVYGPDGLAVALTLERLGAVLTRTDRSAQALPLLERATAIVDAHKGRSEFDTSLVWSRYGSALSAQGHHERALAAHQEAYQRLEAAFGPNHPRLALSAMNYAHAARRAGRPAEAAVWFDKAIKLVPSRASRRFQREALRFELARALWDSGKPARARVEAGMALAAFAERAEKYDGVDHARIERWLQQHPAPAAQ